MPSRTDSNFNGEIRVADQSGARWKLNMDNDVAPVWDLADEIVNLSINEIPRDADDGRGQIRTPPKSKLAAAAVTQMSEASPLDSSSSTSVGSSPHPLDHQIGISHSRGSSTDTTVSSSQQSAASGASRSHLDGPNQNDSKERPHSFSGGLSTSDLRRLQQADESEPRAPIPQQAWVQPPVAYRDNFALNEKPFSPDQLSYPSLANTRHQLAHLARDEIPMDFNAAQQRGFATIPQVSGSTVNLPFVTGRPTGAAPNMSYRQPPRGFPQQGLLPSPTALGYPAGHHTSHLSLGNTQQLYDMMLSAPHEAHPAVTRVQQQHNIYRTNHHHSASDPSTIRDATTLALLSGNMQAFPAIFPPGVPPTSTIPLYANQFYGVQDIYSRPDVAQAMAAHLQSQYPGPYGAVSTPGLPAEPLSPPSSNGQNGPSANNRKLGLYKTELCRSWEEKGTCRYGTKCQFAHGEDELRKVARHPKYKTEICRTFWVSGSCPYGKRCCFIHTELPTSGAAAGNGVATTTENPPPPPHTDGRARSLSTNSDPNDASVSLLARISAKRTQDTTVNNAATPIDMKSPNGFQFTRPGALRVDTSALDGASIKQNKSAYPTFASNGILLPAPDRHTNKSPGPVTAGPDLGRHNEARLAIVGYSGRVSKPTNGMRHSLNGSEGDGGFTTTTPVTMHPSYTLASAEGAPRVNGHVRAGSAGTWASFTRSSLSHHHTASPAGEIMMNSSPWSTAELAVGSSRLNERPWA